MKFGTQESPSQTTSYIPQGRTIRCGFCNHIIVYTVLCPEVTLDTEVDALFSFIFVKWGEIGRDSLVIKMWHGKYGREGVINFVEWIKFQPTGNPGQDFQKRAE